MARKGMRIDASRYDKLVKEIDGLDAYVSQQVRTKAMPQAQQNTVVAAKIAAPVGNARDRNKQSKKHKQKWATTPKLKDTIITVLRTYGKHDFTAYTGVAYPYGNKSYFDYHGTKDRKMVFWGNRPSSPRTRKKFRWMVRVNDMVKGKNRRLIAKTIKAAIKEKIGGETK